MASEIVYFQFPCFFGKKSWHTPRIIRPKDSSKAAVRIFYNRSSSKQIIGKIASFKVMTSSPARFLGDNIYGVTNKAGIGVLSADLVTPSLSVELLKAWNDEYNGVIIEPSSLPSSANAFASALRDSLSSWKSKGKKGIWLKLMEGQAELVPIAIQEGFMYHHAEPGYVMLTYWIPDEPCLLPCGPSHQIGIAGFVINNEKQILVVKEKCSCICSGVWKLPTGYVNKIKRITTSRRFGALWANYGWNTLHSHGSRRFGALWANYSEELFSGAVREVKEETGIDTAFLKLVAFRHVHQVGFDKSDLLFVCMLNPLSLDIKIDENEIQEAKWISVGELLNQQFYKEDDMSKRVIEICMETYENGDTGGFTAKDVISKFDGKMSYLYCKD